MRSHDVEELRANRSNATEELVTKKIHKDDQQVSSFHIISLTDDVHEVERMTLH